MSKRKIQLNDINADDLAPVLSRPTGEPTKKESVFFKFDRYGRIDTACVDNWISHAEMLQKNNNSPIRYQSYWGDGLSIYKVFKIVDNDEIIIFYTDDTNSLKRDKIEMSKLSDIFKIDSYNRILIKFQENLVVGAEVPSIEDVTRQTKFFHNWINSQEEVEEEEIDVVDVKKQQSSEINEIDEDVPFDTSEIPSETQETPQNQAFIDQLYAVPEDKTEEKPSSDIPPETDKKHVVEDTREQSVIEVNDIAPKPKTPTEMNVVIHEDSTYDNRLQTDFGYQDDIDDSIDPETTKEIDKNVFGITIDDVDLNGSVIPKEDDFEPIEKISDDIDVAVENDEQNTGDDEGEDDSKSIIAKQNEAYTKTYSGQFIGYDNSDDLLFSMKRSRTAPIIEKLRDKVEVDSIVPKPISDDEASKAAFLTNHLGPLLKPDIVTIPLLISGTVVHVSAFTYGDLGKIRHLIPEIRDVDNTMKRNQALLKKRELELELIYNRLTYFKGKETKPSFDEFMNTILIPDLPQLFFASYIATYSNTNTYDVSCSHCGHRSTVTRTPRDLCQILSKTIDFDTVRKIIDNTLPKEKLKELNIVVSASKTYSEKAPLPRSGIILRTKIPTLRGYLDGIQALMDIYENSDLNDVDFSTLYFSHEFAGDEPSDYFMRCLLYIDEIIVPNISFDGTKATTRFSSTKDKRIIFDAMSRLHKDDVNAIIRSENIRNMVSIKGIQHYIKLDECPNCKMKMQPFPFNSELIFFLEELA